MPTFPLAKERRQIPTEEDVTILGKTTPFEDKTNRKRENNEE